MNNPLQKIKKKVSAYLERLARANQAAFGDSRIDCCSLHKAGTSGHHGTTQQSDKKKDLKP
ncbi:MAG TPA: LDCC motif putative metal-binding protein [Deltaproteobacteria bacterium]|nr:LDCC motif putative metal-binding protein [Deltaproteobacteria bacterium]HPJ94255.1 LDCC motif putative metal-binding protein [Deltaproteobacteria bacterium]HPR51485.1 LDCC motif putative metal-binding protein [Deltaproteobacteria bacterium]